MSNFAEDPKTMRPSISNSKQAQIDKMENDKHEFQITQWNNAGPIYNFLPELNLNTNLPSGIYELSFHDQKGIIFIYKELKKNEIVEVDNDNIKRVIQEVTKFYSSQELFHKYKMIHKRGILLYGKTASGKTTLVRKAINYVIEDLKGVVIQVSGDSLGLLKNSMGMFAQLEKNRPTLVILEDVETMTKNNYSNEQILLNLLDGYIEKENIVFLATTNHTELLHERLVARPSRFDLRIKIPYPSRDERSHYFVVKTTEEDRKNINLNKWLDDTEDFSYAHCEELLKSILVFNNDYEETILFLKSLKDIPHSKDYETSNGTIGFK